MKKRKEGYGRFKQILEFDLRRKGSLNFLYPSLFTEASCHCAKIEARTAGNVSMCKLQSNVNHQKLDNTQFCLNTFKKLNDLTT